VQSSRIQEIGARVSIAGPEETNKAGIRRFVDEALNRHNFEVVDQTRGEFAEGGKGRMRELLESFPDLRTEISTIIAEGDWVAHRMVHRGTHTGEFRGVPPTGRSVEFQSIVMNRLVDGVVVENWGLHDYPAILAQLRSEQTQSGSP
jgi:predicted ester cyclase